MADATDTGVTAGMIISVRSRRDVLVVDPDRFLTAARRAARDLDPALTEVQAAEAVTDVYDAVFALLDRDGDLAPDPTASCDDQSATRMPSAVAGCRADGLASAGVLRQIVLDDPYTLRDYGCFLPADPFALPVRTDPTDNLEVGPPAEQY